MDKEILEPNPKTDKTPDLGPKPNKFTYLGLALLGLLIVIGAGFYIFKILPQRKVTPTPTPSPTIEEWRQQSEENVNNFLDLWVKSETSENSNQYALKAKDLLTNVAQAKLETFKDEKGLPIEQVKDQLQKFLGLKTIPRTFKIQSSILVDQKSVEVRVYIFNLKDANVAQVLVLTNISEGGIWLIDSVADKGTITPEKSPVTSPNPIAS